MLSRECVADPEHLRVSRIPQHVVRGDSCHQIILARMGVRNRVVIVLPREEAADRSKEATLKMPERARQFRGGRFNRLDEDDEREKDEKGDDVRT